MARCFKPEYRLRSRVGRKPPSLSKRPVERVPRNSGGYPPHCGSAGPEIAHACRIGAAPRHRSFLHSRYGKTGVKETTATQSMSEAAAVAQRQHGACRGPTSSLAVCGRARARGVNRAPAEQAAAQRVGAEEHRCQLTTRQPHPRSGFLIAFDPRAEVVSDQRGCAAWYSRLEAPRRPSQRQQHLPEICTLLACG